MFGRFYSTLPATRRRDPIDLGQNSLPQKVSTFVRPSLASPGKATRGLQQKTANLLHSPDCPTPLLQAYATHKRPASEAWATRLATDTHRHTSYVLDEVAARLAALAEKDRRSR